LMCPMQQSGDSNYRQLWNLARICNIEPIKKINIQTALPEL